MSAVARNRSSGCDPRAMFPLPSGRPPGPVFDRGAGDPPAPRPFSQGFSFQGFVPGHRFQGIVQSGAPLHSLATGANWAKAADAIGAALATGAAPSARAAAAGPPLSGNLSGRPFSIATGTSMSGSSAASSPTEMALSARSPATSASRPVTSDSGIPIASREFSLVNSNLITSFRVCAALPRLPPPHVRRRNLKDSVVNRIGAPDGTRTRIFQPPKLALFGGHCPPAG